MLAPREIGNNAYAKVGGQRVLWKLPEWPIVFFTGNRKFARTEKTDAVSKLLERPNKTRKRLLIICDDVNE